MRMFEIQKWRNVQIGLLFAEIDRCGSDFIQRLALFSDCGVETELILDVFCVFIVSSVHICMDDIQIEVMTLVILKR